MWLQIAPRKILISSIGVQWGPYGMSITSTFAWKDFGPHMGLLYFTGTAFVIPPHWKSCSTHMFVYRDSYMRRICATFGTYEDSTDSTGLTTVVKYERQSAPEPDIQRTATLSKFALFVTYSPISYTLLTALKQPHRPNRHPPCRDRQYPFSRTANSAVHATILRRRATWRVPRSIRAEHHHAGRRPATCVRPNRVPLHGWLHIRVLPSF